jgi:hypothetical protein
MGGDVTKASLRPQAAGAVEHNNYNYKHDRRQTTGERRMGVGVGEGRPFIFLGNACQSP